MSNSTLKSAWALKFPSFESKNFQIQSLIGKILKHKFLKQEKSTGLEFPKIINIQILAVSFK